MTTSSAHLASDVQNSIFAAHRPSCVETLFPAKIEFCTSEPLGCDRRLRLDGLAIRPTLVMEQVHEVLNDGSGGTIGRALACQAETSGAAAA